MISYIGIALGLILAFLFISYRNDIFWLLNAWRYIQQGIATRYHPVIGYMNFVNTPDDKDGDGLVRWREVYKNKKDPSKTEPLILTNGISSHPILFINDEKLAKDWYSIKTKVALPINMANFPFTESYFWKDNKTALDQRGILSKLFLMESVKKLTPQLIQIMKRHLSALKAQIEQKGAEGGFADLSLEKSIRDINNDVLGFVLFGGDTPLVEGVPIPVQLDKVTNQSFMYSQTNFWHKVTSGWYTELGLSPEFNEIKRLKDLCVQAVKKVVNDRTHSRDYQLGLNLVDIIIEHNKKMEAEGRSEKVFSSKEILDNIVMFIFAAVDTTNTFTRTCIYLLGKHQEHQKVLREQVREHIFGGSDTFAGYMDCDYLEDFVTECFRVFGPAWSTFFTRTYKNCKVGKYRVYKGTGVMISFYTINKRPEDFEKPLEFDLTKYEDKKRTREMKKYLLIPFGAGNRNCIAQNLALMSIKIFVANLVDKYEVKLSDKPNRTHAHVTCGVDHAWAKLRALK